MKSSPGTADVDYSFPQISKKFLVPWFLIVFVFSLWQNLPLLEKLKIIIAKNISTIPGCPVYYDNLDFSFFLPKAVLEKVSIPASCYGGQSGEVLLNNVSLYFRGLSFSPFGPHFKLVTQLENNEFSAFITTGLKEMAVNIDDNVIDLAKLKPEIMPLKMHGPLHLSTLIKTNDMQIKDFKFLLKSDDFSILPQTIMGLNLPKIDFKNLFIKAQQTQGQKVEIEQIVLGNDQSPIKANFKGNIQLNLRQPTHSAMILKGEVFFSEEFLNEFSLIKLFLDRFTKKDDYYQLTITGTLSNPSFN